ncbi:hypothetical protein HG536_0A09300 [Torulaspora globosa]|uniref:Mediator of RNA polymerase II transcription subunit 12 n=1 Tax=Torulaspora globosa TaxID=48254 RepID=A0A7G3ZC77_9SACH|nr:uncharacterized protein HG536_0A09300 [Torulaspora globosa]QLL31113.1 hypothetical protein HG536_0A09300 [Torulaspora globosa]
MSPSKYILTPPDDLHPYVQPSEDQLRPEYPDFEPWEHKKEEDQILLNFVAKGYYSTSKVNFESISARSSLPESLPKLSDRLADQFSRVLRIREQEINRIPATNGGSHAPFSDLSGPGFQLPSRVTLTEHRREIWLQELSSPYVSLPKLSMHIPHGLKRRQILEQCCAKQIPLKRAIWLIKCCYSMEWKVRNSKQRLTEKASDVDLQLTKEWTDNFVYILEKLIFEMVQYDNDPLQLKRWKSEVGYFLKLLGNCYTLRLIDKETFHHWLVEFGAKVRNLEFLPLTLHILTIFWDDICQPTEDVRTAPQGVFLVSKVAEMLLNKYHSISHSKSMINDEKYIINDIKKNGMIKNSLKSIISLLIRKLFQSSSLEAFIFPNPSWDIYKPILEEVIGTISSNENSDVAIEVRKKLELISYRNESLALKNTGPAKPAGRGEQLEDIYNSGSILKLNAVDVELTQRLDDNPVDFDWTSYLEKNMLNVTEIRQLVLWAIHPSRATHYEANQLVAKIILLKVNTVDVFQEYAIEDIIWSLVFQLAKLTDQERSMTIDLSSLYRLLNLLITYGILKVPTYIRKLISSGILYLPESNDKFMHCNVLINLKISPLMKNQYNLVLRNVMEYDATFFLEYNFDQLVQKTEEFKEVILNKNDATKTDFPLSIKIMTAEWYLNALCSGNPSAVDKVTLVRNFQVFCFHLDAFHYFYKWIEFVVYHQLLSNIEALEALMDILLCYGKLFSQFINDHILFTKTFIFMYTKVLKIKDGNSYAVTSLMPFWRFFMKNFSVALNIDEDLSSEFSAVCEEEKTKGEKFSKSKQQALDLYQAFSATGSKTATWSFPEIFQTSLRGFLITKNKPIDQKRYRYDLLLLMNAGVKDYNKFMAIYLKKRNFEQADLICLVSAKLLSFEQIHNVLGTEIVLSLLSIEAYQYGLHFEYHKEQFIRSNFKTVLAACQTNLSEHYTLLLNLLLKFGTDSKVASISNKAIVMMLSNNPSSANHIMEDLLFHGPNRTDSNDDSTLEEHHGSEIYEMLNFTNLWIFQAYTSYQVEVISSTDATQLESFLFDIIDRSGSNCLCANIFDKIASANTMLSIINIFERDFFQKCLLNQHPNDTYSNIVIEIITSLSQKFHNEVKISGENFELLQKVLDLYSEFDEESLKPHEFQFEITLKLLTIHQASVFHQVMLSMQNRNITQADRLINRLFTLFDEIITDLRLKLMLYEILNSLKSYCIYISTTSTGFETPKRLLSLPPFQISSFTKNGSAKLEDNKELKLGLVMAKPAPEDESNRWFIFDKDANEYSCKLRNKPYHLIANFQTESTSCFNNSCLNLSLFNTCFEKKNPS